MGDKRAKHAVVEARQTTLFSFKVVGAHLLSEGQKSQACCIVEARQTALFAFKAVGAHLLRGGQVRDKKGG